MKTRPSLFLDLPAELRARWQETLDLLAEVGAIAVTVIARERVGALEIALVSRGGERWIHAGDTKQIGEGSFCDAVVREGRAVHVRDARTEPRWTYGMEQAGGLVSYIGYPLRWPDGTLFGSLCALDTQPNDFDGLFCRQLEQAVRAIEAELAALDENLRLHAEIAAHRATEHALRESESRLLEAQELAHIGHWHLDISSAKLFWSAEIYRIFEIDAAHFEASYDAFLALIHPDDRQAVDDAYNASVEQRTGYQLEHRLRLADGRVKWVVERGATTYGADGTPLWSTGTVQDITARKAAEREQAMLADIVRHSGELVNVASLDGRMLFLNEAGCGMLGIPPDEVAQHGILDVIPAHLRARVDDDLLPSLATAGYWEGDLQYRNLATGELRDYHAVCFAVNDPHTGQPSYLANVSLDITDRLAAERERLALERRLLNTQRLESLGLMAGHIAHDFNNLLQAILGNLELLRTPADAAPEQEALQRARQAAIAGAGITRQLLTFAGRDNPPQAQVDLAQLITDSVHLLRAVVGKRAVLQVDPPLAPLPVHAVGSQLQQLVINLVMNAADASANGSLVSVSCGTTVAVPRLLARSPVPMAHEGPVAWLEVRDEGTGMDSETLARLFEPFYTTKPQGRGLGMSSALGIVRSHGGAILVDSAPGAGTAIRVLLPLAGDDAPPAAQRQHTHTASRALAGRRILLVDDEPTIRVVAGALLERAGAEVLTADSGDAALALVDQLAQAPDGVVLDLTMPGLDGADTLLHLRARHPGLPVLLASGFDRAQAMTRLGDLPRVAFIGKPWRADELVAALARLLDGD